MLVRRLLDVSFVQVKKDLSDRLVLFLDMLLDQSGQVIGLMDEQLEGLGSTDFA